MAKHALASMAFRRLDRSALLRSTALQAVAVVVMVVPAAAQPAPSARLQGSLVVAGSASITTTSNATDIAQSTNRAAVNWRSFDIGSNQTVTFQQPSTDSVTLNRVAGGDPSAIAGKINGNGQIAITSQSGVTFWLQADTLTFVSGGMSLPALSAPGGSVILQPLTANRGITLTSSSTLPGGVLALTAAELGLVTASTLQLAHPFYWAPFALVGEGRGRTLTADADGNTELAGL